MANESSMSEQGFISACERLLDRIEDLLDDADVDADTRRSGHVLEVSFDGAGTVVINGQVPMREIWLAAPSGAHHFRNVSDRWIDTRSGEPLPAVLSRCVSELSGTPVLMQV